MNKRFENEIDKAHINATKMICVTYSKNIGNFFSDFSLNSCSDYCFFCLRDKNNASS